MDKRIRTRVERLANKVRHEYAPGEVKIQIFEVLSAMGIETLFKDLGPKVYGASFVDGDKKVISVNEANHENRQRFSAAHELGHILLHQEKSLNVADRLLFRDETSAQGSDWREIEANFFAASLLMPEDLIEEEIQKYPFGLDEQDVGSLAEAFGVSSISMSIRLSALGYF